MWPSDQACLGAERATQPPAGFPSIVGEVAGQPKIPWPAESARSQHLGADGCKRDEVADLRVDLLLEYRTGKDPVVAYALLDEVPLAFLRNA